MTSYCRGVIITYFFHTEICMPADYSNVDRPAFIQHLATVTLPAVWGAWQYFCPISKSDGRSYRQRWRALIASMVAIMGGKQHQLPWNTGILWEILRCTMSIIWFHWICLKPYLKVSFMFANNMSVSGFNSWWYISFVYTALGFMSIGWLLHFVSTVKTHDSGSSSFSGSCFNTISGIWQHSEGQTGHTQVCLCWVAIN